MFSYARDHLVYKCGNLTDTPSRFGWFRRRRLEKQINYTNTKHPIFMYAYRAFIDALATNDRPTLQKMCERTLFRALDHNHSELSKRHAEYYLVSQGIQMKMKLIDTRVITGGVHIDRSKNLSAHYYDVVEGVDDKGKASDMKITYKKKQKVIMGKEVGIDFEKLMKERKP